MCAGHELVRVRGKTAACGKSIPDARLEQPAHPYSTAVESVRPGLIDMALREQSKIVSVLKLKYS